MFYKALALNKMFNHKVITTRPRVSHRFCYDYNLPTTPYQGWCKMLVHFLLFYIQNLEKVCPLKI